MKTTPPTTSPWAKRWLWVVLVTGVVVFIVIRHVLVYTGSPTKDKWLQQQATRLRKLVVTKEMLTAAIQWDELAVGQTDKKWHYHIPRECLIYFGNGNWAYAVSHSEHDNYTNCTLRQIMVWPKEVVSDVTLVIDQQGKLYTNDGHICGPIQLVSDRPVANLNDFLQTQEFPTPLCDGRWKTMTPE